MESGENSMERLLRPLGIKQESTQRHLELVWLWQAAIFVSEALSDIVEIYLGKQETVILMCWQPYPFW